MKKMIELDPETQEAVRAFTEHFVAYMSGSSDNCPWCLRPVTGEQQANLSVYLIPCGHRFTGRAVHIFEKKQEKPSDQ